MSEHRVIRDINVVEIQEYQRNRHPMLFIDYVDEVVVGSHAEGYKQFTFNEWFFPVHYPDDPNVPGFILVEMLAQMFLMTFLSYDEHKGSKASAISYKEVRFKKKIVPGMTMKIKAELDSFRRGMAKGRSIGYVDGELACSIELQVGIPEVLNEYLPKK